MFGNVTTPPTGVAHTHRHFHWFSVDAGISGDDSVSIGNILKVILVLSPCEPGLTGRFSILSFYNRNNSLIENIIQVFLWVQVLVFVFPHQCDRSNSPRSIFVSACGFGLISQEKLLKCLQLDVTCLIY